MSPRSIVSSAMLCLLLAGCSSSSESSDTNLYVGSWAALSINSPGYCNSVNSDGCAYYQNVTIASDGSFAESSNAWVYSFTGTISASGQISGTVVWNDGPHTSRVLTGTCSSQSYCGGTITGGTWLGGAATFYFQRN